MCRTGAGEAAMERRARASAVFRAWGGASAAVVLSALLAVAACGGSGTGAGASPACAGSDGPTVQFSEFKFDPSSPRVKSGRVTFCLVNTGSVAHDLVVADPSGKVLGKSERVPPGGSSRLSVDLQPGTYALICDLPGHKESGMTGKLTVE